MHLAEHKGDKYTMDELLAAIERNDENLKQIAAHMLIDAANYGASVVSSRSFIFLLALAHDLLCEVQA